MSDNNQALKDAGPKVTLPRLKILEVLQQPDRSTLQRTVN